MKEICAECTVRGSGAVLMANWQLHTPLRRRALITLASSLAHDSTSPRMVWNMYCHSDTALESPKGTVPSKKNCHYISTLPTRNGPLPSTTPLRLPLAYCSALAGSGKRTV